MRMRISRKKSNTDIALAIAIIAMVLAVVGWGLPQMSVTEPNTTSQCMLGKFANNSTEINGTLVLYCSSVGWTDLTNLPSPCDANKFVIAVGASLSCTFVDWTQINNFPGGCTSGMFVTAVGASLTCTSPSNPEVASTAICQAGKFVNQLNESSSGVLSYSCFYPDWSRLTGFPSNCNAGQFVTGVGLTLSCQLPLPSKVASGSGVGKTAGDSNIATFTDASGFNGIYSIGCDLDVTAFTVGIINCQVTYTDWNSGSQTITINSAIGLGDALGASDTLMSKASTSITCKTTGTFTATYNEACFITLQAYQ